MTERRPQPWGPWTLALGALVLGVVALAVEGMRAVRHRLAR